MTISPIVIEKLDNAQIRRTDDGRFSIFDVIRAVGGQKNPREVWKRLTERYSAVVGKCDNWKFPGARQRETPVTDLEGIFYIIGLLPGFAGHKYREYAAELVKKYLEAAPEVAISVVDRTEKTEDLDRIAKRIESKKIRNHYTQTIQAHGVTKGEEFARVTNATYTGYLGQNATQLKITLGLKKNDNIRDNLPTKELTGLSMSENLAAIKIEKVNAQGVNQICDISYKAGKFMKNAIDQFLAD